MTSSIAFVSDLRLVGRRARLMAIHNAGTCAKGACTGRLERILDYTFPRTFALIRTLRIRAREDSAFHLI